MTPFGKMEIKWEINNLAKQRKPSLSCMGEKVDTKKKFQPAYILVYLS